LRRYLQSQKVVKSFQKEAHYFRSHLSETYAPFMYISDMSHNDSQTVLSTHIRPVEDIYDILVLVCFECGSEIPINSYSCPNCKDNLKSELQFKYTKKSQYQSNSQN
jgi:hypothetical protein